MNYTTPTEYFQAVEVSRKKLESATALEWSHEHTGGGCDAFFHYTSPDHSTYYMVTVDASAPTTEAEWAEITLGYYTLEDSEGVIVENVSTFSDVVAFFIDGNPHPSSDEYTEPCEECGAEMTSTGDGWTHALTADSHKCYTAYRWGVK